jgi:predicted dehydrogenase
MPMRVAVAGLGWWGKQIISCLKNSPRFEVVCGVDPIASEATNGFLTDHGVRYISSLDSVLADSNVDGVILATPHQLHEAQCLQVLAAGKELFCEKPLTMTAAGAARVLEASAQAGRVLGVGHERRYEECFELVGRLIREGVLGKPLLFDANISHDLFRDIDRSNWRLDPRHAPAGMMTATGIHQTDLCCSYFGSPVEVRAETSSLIFDPPATDFVTATVKFASGVRGAVTLLSCVPYYGRVTVFGDKGWVEVVTEGNVDQGKPTIVTVCKGTNAPREVMTFQPTDTVTANFEAWAAAAAGEKPYRFTPAQLLDNVKIFEAVVASAQAGGKSIRL